MPTEATARSAAPSSRTATIERLREQIRKVEAAPRQYLVTLATGVAQLDALGAFRLGSGVELSGEEGAGRASVALALAASACREKRLVAWVDGPQELYPPAAEAVGVELRRLLMVRPKSPGQLVWAATQLLRSGAFTLVVLDLTHTGVLLSMGDTKKLLDAARTGGSLLVALTSGGAHAPGLLRLGLRTQPPAGSGEGGRAGHLRLVARPPASSPRGASTRGRSAAAGLGDVARVLPEAGTVSRPLAGALGADRLPGCAPGLGAEGTLAASAGGGAPNATSPRADHPSAMQPGTSLLATSLSATQLSADHPGADYPGAMQTSATHPSAAPPSTSLTATSSSADHPNVTSPSATSPSAMQPGTSPPSAMQSSAMQPSDLGECPADALVLEVERAAASSVGGLGRSVSFRRSGLVRRGKPWAQRARHLRWEGLAVPSVTPLEVLRRVKRHDLREGHGGFYGQHPRQMAWPREGGRHG